MGITFVVGGILQHDLLHLPLHLRRVLHIAAIEADRLQANRPFEVVFRKVALLDRLLAGRDRIVELPRQNEVAV